MGYQEAFKPISHLAEAAGIREAVEEYRDGGSSHRGRMAHLPCEHAAKWIKFDARGNKPGVHTHFSTEGPSLAFECHPEYEDHFWKGVYAGPHLATMRALEESRHLQDVIDKLPDEIDAAPDADG